MKKLKRDLTKPEKVVVKKTVVAPKEEYPEGPDFEWADYWFEGEAEPEVSRGLTKPEKVGLKKTVAIPEEKYPDGGDFEWADYWFEGEAKHEVAKGDNLTKISKKYSVPVDSLTKWNGIKNPDKLKIGESIKLSK